MSFVTGLPPSCRFAMRRRERKDSAAPRSTVSTRRLIRANLPSIHPRRGERDIVPTCACRGCFLAWFVKVDTYAESLLRCRLLRVLDPHQKHGTARPSRLPRVRHQNNRRRWWTKCEGRMRQQDRPCASFRDGYAGSIPRCTTREVDEENLVKPALSQHLWRS